MGQEILVEQLEQQDGVFEVRLAGRSPDSPWNPYATHPPRVYNGNYFLGYLTTNESLYPRIDPYWLMDYLDIWVWD